MEDRVISNPLNDYMPGGLRLWIKILNPVASELVLLLKSRGEGDVFWDVLSCDGVVHIVECLYLDSIY